MFNVGFTELIVLGVIGLLVLGPEQLPTVARKLARILNDLKRAKDEILSPVEDLKTEARMMLERARDLARQAELDEIVRRSMEPDKNPSHKVMPNDPSAVIDPPPHSPISVEQNATGSEVPTPAAPETPPGPPTIGTPKKDV